jgi:hypothetical protein
MTLYEEAIVALRARGYSYNANTFRWLGVEMPSVRDNDLRHALWRNDPTELPRMCADDVWGERFFGPVSWKHLVKPLLADLLKL